MSASIITPSKKERDLDKSKPIIRSPLTNAFITRLSFLSIGVMIPFDLFQVFNIQTIQYK